MANMYPKNIAEYMPTESERIVYQELQNQLPDSFDVFYSVKWNSYQNGQLYKSEADFIVASPDYGFLCLEVKGGCGIRIADNVWYVDDGTYGERRLNQSPYDQAEKSLYHFVREFSNKYNVGYQGIYGAGAIFPFYAIGQDMTLDNRHRICTIDCNDLNELFPKIKKMFRAWGGQTYGRRFYPHSQHKALLELIRERLAIAAAAGALVKYKEEQLCVINRVQDNYIYLLSNMRQFFMKGGAGTGKTWIAMKMAEQEAEISGHDVLFLCASQPLANKVSKYLSPKVRCLSVTALLSELAEDLDAFEQPLYAGVSETIKADAAHYDAVFVDEAQDFTEEWAQIVKRLLKDPLESRLGVFYDDVQILRKDSFGEGFGIQNPPYLLHENIRNTSNIYCWTSEKTNLGKDMIANPVEGPTPITEHMMEKGQLTHRLETLLRKFLEEEHLSESSLVIISDDVDWFLSEYGQGIAKWKFSVVETCELGELQVSSISDYKGLESDMVIYIHEPDISSNKNYIAYTRAKYYLIELVRDF